MIQVWEDVEWIEITEIGDEYDSARSSSPSSDVIAGLFAFN